MPAGAPRKYDRMAEVAEFVEWAKNTPDAFTVPQFATSKGYSSEMMCNWALEDDEFRGAYLLGKEFLGINRLKATCNFDDATKPRLDRSIYHRATGNYDADLRAYEREETVFAIKAKAAEAIKIPPNDCHLEEMVKELKAHASQPKTDPELPGSD